MIGLTCGGTTLYMTQLPLRFIGGAKAARLKYMNAMAFMLWIMSSYSAVAGLPSFAGAEHGH